MNSNKLLVGLLALLIVVLLGVAAVLGYVVLSGDSTVEDSADTIADATVPPTATPVTDTGIGDVATLPAPPLVLFPTDTPAPATDTPEPTATPVPPTATPVPPTATPVPPTNTPVPVVIPPTATPVPPTNTPAPVAPPPGNPNGISATFWNLQDRSDFRPGGLIWFEWTIVNSSGFDQPYGCIGAMPQKDGVDRPDLFKTSWGGSPGDAVPPQGFSADDNIVLNEPGSYTLRLAISFDDYSQCSTGNATYVTLSNAIPFEVR